MAFPDGWVRRCALVIQSGQVTDNETNFPLLVTEDTLPSEIFDADGSYPALNGGGDIRFSSDEAGNTQLACEIESFVTDNDPANGKAAIWVKIPSLSSSSNQTIYIWYSKAGESQPAEDNAYGKENVWDSNFKMVQHMNQIPDGTADEIVDSTSNDNDGTTSGMDSADQVAGQIDGSLDFDGGDDYVEVSDSASLDVTNITISVWLKANSLANYGGIIDKNRDGAFGWYTKNNNAIKTQIKVGSSLYTPSFLGLGVDTLYNLVQTYDGETIRLYNNAIAGPIDTDPSGNILINDYDVVIGCLQSATKVKEWFFNGIIDEVRISNVARSAGWIATEYNNQKIPWTFLIEGTPETPGAPPITFIPQIIMF